MNDTPGLAARYYLSQFNMDEKTKNYNAGDSINIRFILAKLLANRYWGYENKSIYLDKKLGLRKVLNLLTDEYEIEFLDTEEEDFGYIEYYYDDDEKKQSSSSENTTITKIVLCYDTSYTLKVVRIYEDDKNDDVVYFYKFENKEDLLDRFNIFTNMNENCIDFIYIGVPSILLANQTMLVYDIDSTGHDLVEDVNEVLKQIYSIKNNHLCFSSQFMDSGYGKTDHDFNFSTLEEFLLSFVNKVMIEAEKDQYLDFPVSRMIVHLLKDSSYLKEYWYSINSFKNKTEEDKIKLSNKLVSIFISDISNFQCTIRTKDIVKYKGVNHECDISEEYLRRNKNWYKTWILTKSAYKMKSLPMNDQPFCVPCDDEYNTKQEYDKRKELYETLRGCKFVQEIQELNKEKDVMFLVEALARKVVYKDKDGTIKYTIYPRCRLYSQQVIVVQEEEDKTRKFVRVQNKNFIELAMYPYKLIFTRNG